MTEYLPELLTGLASLGAGVGAKWGYDRYRAPTTHAAPSPSSQSEEPMSPPPAPKVCMIRTFVYPDNSRIIQHARCGAGHGPHTDDVPKGWVVMTSGGHEIPR